MSDLGHPLDLIEEGKKHLSEKLRSDFEAKGYGIVHAEVLGNRYEKLEKCLAAIAWMDEKRVKKESTENRRFWIPLVISVLALIVATISLLKSMP